MLVILVLRGKIFAILDEKEKIDPDDPEPKELQEGVDYKVEYLLEQEK